MPPDWGIKQGKKLMLQKLEGWGYSTVKIA